jgi:hypothetical protein
VVTEKGETTTSFLLIQQARPSDSGTYQCNPSNAQSKSVVVHVLNGEYLFTKRLTTAFTKSLIKTTFTKRLTKTTLTKRLIPTDFTKTLTTIAFSKSLTTTAHDTAHFNYFSVYEYSVS